MRAISALGAALVGACCLPTTGFADFTDSAIEEITVVGARTPRDARDVAANVEIVTRDALLDSIAIHLGDVVRYTPGVSVTHADSRFADTEFNIRGLSGNRVVTLVDNVPVPDQFDIGAFANAGQNYIMPGAISRIEILRGPASTLFGSDALGGVIAIVTRDPQDYAPDSGLGLSHIYSSADHAANTELWTASGNDRLGGVLHIAALNANEPDRSAGNAVDTRDQRRQSLMAKGSVAVGGGSLNLKAEWLDEDVDSEMQAVLGYGRRYRNTTVLLGDDQRTRRSLSIGYDWRDASWIDHGRATLFWQDTEVTQNTYEERGIAPSPVTIERSFQYDTEATGLVADFEKSFEWLGTSHRLGWGVQLNHAEVTEQRNGMQTDWTTGLATNTLLGESMPVRDFPNSKVRELGLYLHDEIFLAKWTLLPGLRLDSYDLEASADAMYRADNPTTPVVDADETALSPKFGVLYDVTAVTQLFAQYAHGFRAPPFEDVNIGLDVPLFNYRAIPNPDLEAETSDGLEFGIRYGADEVRLQATLFAADYDNFIETKVNMGRDADGVLIFQSRNIDEARVYGVEFSVAASLERWVPGLEWSAKASWVHGDNRVTDQPLNTVDPAELVTTFAWRRGSWRVGLMATIVAGQDRIDQSAGQLFATDGYALTDLTVSFDPHRRVRIDIGFFNIFDRTHWQWASVRNRPTDDPLIDNLSAPGRYGSVALHLQI